MWVRRAVEFPHHLSEWPPLTCFLSLISLYQSPPFLLSFTFSALSILEFFYVYVLWELNLRTSCMLDEPHPQCLTERF